MSRQGRAPAEALQRCGGEVGARLSPWKGQPGLAEKPDLRRIGNDNGSGKTDEKSVLDDARDRRQRAGERLRVGDGAKGAIEDVVAAIGDESMALPAAAQAHL